MSKGAVAATGSTPGGEGQATNPGDKEGWYRVIPQANHLKAKVGSGGLKPGALEAAEGIVLKMQEQCLRWVRAQVAVLEELSVAMWTGDREEMRGSLSKVAVEIHAFAGSCDLVQIGKIAQLLDMLAGRKGPFEDRDIELIDPHLQALQLAVMEFESGAMNEEKSNRLIAGLRAAVETRLS